MGTGATHNSPLALALAMRGRPVKAATASLSELAPQLTQVAEVALLLAASDVTLLRMAVPPLSAPRLKAALPSLVEDHIIGDTADCAIATGPETDGQRLIAVSDRAWLQSWINALQQLGARNIRVLPMSLCLPVPGAQVSAALLKNANRYELALRLSSHQGIGLPVEVDNETQLPGAVAQLLAMLAPQRPVQLSVPAAQSEWFKTWTEAQHGSQITLIEQQWIDWIAASARVPLDLMTAISGTATTPLITALQNNAFIGLTGEY
jgi:general secretion pathway protein L